VILILYYLTAEVFCAILVVSKQFKLIMIIDYNYQKVEVPQEIVEYCDHFTVDADRNELRYLDCVYMNMGYYGNDPDQLKEMRQRIYPIFE